MKHTKQFKIGEYAHGGIIKVVVEGQRVSMDALDYNTKKPMPFCYESFSKDDIDKMDTYLNNLTTSYYADKVLTYITSL